MGQSKFSWLLKMAWRDSRRNQGKLLLFISSIVLGISALVAINSFSENLQSDIDREAKTLLGADLKIESNATPNEKTKALLDQFEGERAQSTSFVSMVLFPKNNKTKLSNINALKGGFPFYGNFNTIPENIAPRIQNEQKALVDHTLMLQYDIQTGDSIKVGELMFEVIGALKSVPGRSGIASAVAPAIFIGDNYLAATELIQPGSRISYQYYFKTTDLVALDQTVDKLMPQLEEQRLRVTTVERRKRSIGKAFSQVATFFNLVGFISLLLGCIGVASAVHIYVKDKLKTVAILRCMGASGKESFQIFFLQIGILGFLGAIIGVLLGSGLQIFLPKILEGFLPIQKVSTNVSWSAIASGMIVGLSITLLFAAIPLLAIRKIAPLNTLRGHQDTTTAKDPIHWIIYGIILLFIMGFTYWQTKNWMATIAFPLGIILAFLLLAGTAQLLIFTLKKYFRSQWSYVWRQGIANLFRPHNQTLTLVVSIGLGSMLIATLFFIQGLLLKQIAFSASGEQPNIVLFNIQNKQLDAVNQLTKKFDMPILQEVPIVTMRLDNINGKNKADFLADSTKMESKRRERWIFNREFRVTYRDTLIDSEELTEGKWYPNKAEDGTIYISLSDNAAEDMDVQIGDQIAFNVQGAILSTKVGSIRKIDWGRLQTNFMVVFPKGVLEKAPQTQVIVSKTKDIEQSAKYQQAIVGAFPNVSIVDLSTVLSSVDNVLTKVSFVIQFMALFSILTGLLVLISTIILSKYQRIKESVLLRTIGAKRQQIIAINLIEYFLLGALAALTGIILAFIGSWLLTVFSFKVPFMPDWEAPIIIFMTITGLTILIGFFNNRSILNKPPLAVLRDS